ncbi:olfactory receptor 7G1-like [Loxodonta africana]|uniref:olfactory receptor 7G1-like n=1 Tax=Loxodonta africana TaxID=9785 RepID=UPI0030D3E51E
MEPRNQTGVSEFFLLGLAEDPELQPLLYNIFLFMYLVTILGNLLIVLAISYDSHLHTPMYFFLSNLSFTDICLSTTTVPKMLVNIKTQRNSITYTGCLTQVCAAIIFGSFENFLLGIMAYDRYVAICHPLRYTVIMNPHFLSLLVILSLFISIMNALVHSLMLLRLSFCTDLEIPHFFCEIVQVLKLACSNTLINNIILYFMSSIFGGIPFSGIIFSYTQIVSSILRMPSAAGKYKAFSTCGSHLTVVFLFYGTGFGVYISSAFTHSSRKTTVASVMYIVVPQMMNPFIYSLLRNRDMKGAVRKIIGRMLYF